MLPKKKKKRQKYSTQNSYSTELSGTSWWSSGNRDRLKRQGRGRRFERGRKREETQEGMDASG